MSINQFSISGDLFFSDFFPLIDLKNVLLTLLKCKTFSTSFIRMYYNSVKPSTEAIQNELDCQELRFQKISKRKLQQFQAFRISKQVAY